jgi:hypothetical protein
MTKGDLPGERDGMNPYRPPDADSPQADTLSQLDGPSVFDVVRLLTVQVGMVLGTNSASTLFFHRSWSGTALIAIVVGGMAFAFLKKQRKPAPWTWSFRLRMALWGALVWGCVSGVIFLLIKYVWETQFVLSGQLFLVGAVTLCLLYFGATLFGLWLVSRR